jgi:thymidylate synthase
MNYVDRQYLELLIDVMENGVEKDDRTGTGTIAVFDRTMRFNLSETFPILTTKKVHFKSVVHELLWFLKGTSNIKYLKDNGVTIWDEWADEDGELGPVYGVQWRRFGEYYVHSMGRPPYKVEGVDQIAEVIEQIKTNPNSRRLIVSSWNATVIDLMALPPCHFAFIFNVMGGKLHCSLFQRSCDVFLGVPFNISSYSLLTCMVAHVVGIPPGEFVWHGIDVHIYKNHFKQVEEQLTRTGFPLPKLVLSPGVRDIDEFEYDDIILSDYQSHPTIKAPISV